jgi:hypothetical protein
MPVLPSKNVERIQWFEQRIAAWTASAVGIGITVPQATTLSAKIIAARTAFNAAETARQASKNATLSLNTSMSDLSDFGADLIATIKAFAETTNNPNVYVLASVPPPAPPGPVGPPEAPTDVSADPNADGTITVKWKGSTANQTFFSVWRKTSAQSQFVQIGAIATKTFIDDGVPNGVTAVSYVLRAQRGTSVSQASEQVTVQFGGLGLAA